MFLLRFKSAETEEIWITIKVNLLKGTTGKLASFSAFLNIIPSSDLRSNVMFSGNGKPMRVLIAAK